ncbi:MAG: hypothetical protein J6N49_06700 [Alphaproteobacteria bacterium]|nr:hypothetical protein [Alphaproteobacteria bacterium]
MIAYTTFLLFFVGIFGSFKTGVKVDKILSFVTFTSLFLIFGNFCESWLTGDEQTFSFMWNSSPGGDIKIDIISNPYNYGIIFPFFMITLLNAADNQIFRYEERRSIFNSLAVLNLATLIMMITSNNFVQLLSMVFVVDILALFVIKDVNSYKRYFLLNMTADMILFMVLAVINSLVDSLDIRQILEYKQIGYHTDFVAVFGLTAVFMKLGFFAFHIGVTSLNQIRLHRLQHILFLSAPVTAVVLLLKFHALWSMSVYYTVYIDVMCIATMALSFYGCLVLDNLKSKIIYWQLMFWALFVELLKFNGFVWSNLFTSLLLDMYLIVCGFYWMYHYFNRRPLVSQMMCLTSQNPFRQDCAFVLILLPIVLMANTLAIMYNNTNRYYIWSFAILFVLSVALLINQVIFTSTNRKKLKMNLIPVHWLYLAEQTGIAVILWYYFHSNEISVLGVSLAFIILCCINPLQKMSILYSNKWVQTLDFFGILYRTLIKSLRLSGKILWLLVDRLLMEKVILGLIKLLGKSNIRLFRQVHQSRLGGGGVVLIVLILIIWLSYRQGVHING